MKKKKLTEEQQEKKANFIDNLVFWVLLSAEIVGLIIGIYILYSCLTYQLFL